MLGIKWQAIWLSAWIRSMIIYFFISLLITILLKVTYAPNVSNSRYLNKQILTNTDFMIALTVLITYSVQVATFNLFLTQFFNKRK